MRTARRENGELWRIARASTGQSLLGRNVQRVHHRPLDEAGRVSPGTGSIGSLHSRALNVLGMHVREDDVGAIVRVPRRTGVLAAPAVRVFDAGQAEVWRLARDVDPVVVGPVVED